MAMPDDHGEIEDHLGTQNSPKQAVPPVIQPPILVYSSPVTYPDSFDPSNHDDDFSSTASDQVSSILSLASLQPVQPLSSSSINNNSNNNISSSEESSQMRMDTLYRAGSNGDSIDGEANTSTGTDISEWCGPDSDSSEVHIVRDNGHCADTDRDNQRIEEKTNEAISTVIWRRSIMFGPDDDDDDSDSSCSNDSSSSSSSTSDEMMLDQSTLTTTTSYTTVLANMELDQQQKLDEDLKPFVSPDSGSSVPFDGGPGQQLQYSRNSYNDECEYNRIFNSENSNQNQYEDEPPISCTLSEALEEIEGAEMSELDEDEKDNSQELKQNTNYNQQSNTTLQKTSVITEAQQPAVKSVLTEAQQPAVTGAITEVTTAQDGTTETTTEANTSFNNVLTPLEEDGTSSNASRLLQTTCTELINEAGRDDKSKAINSIALHTINASDSNIPSAKRISSSHGKKKGGHNKRPTSNHSTLSGNLSISHSASVPILLNYLHEEDMLTSSDIMLEIGMSSSSENLLDSSTEHSTTQLTNPEESHLDDDAAIWELPDGATTDEKLSFIMEKINVLRRHQMILLQRLEKDRKVKVEEILECNQSLSNIIKSMEANDAAHKQNDKKLTARVDLIENAVVELGRNYTGRYQPLLGVARPSSAGKRGSMISYQKAEKLKNFFGAKPPLIDQFLKDLGYEDYIPRFSNEHITLDELPYLQEKDFITLGIPLGPRLRIMNEAKQL